MTLALFIALILFSCTDKAVNENKVRLGKQKEVEYKTVNFIGHWKEDLRNEEIISEFVREYEFLNQDIKVNLKFPEELGFERYDSTSTKKYLNTIFKRENPKWDIVLLNNDISDSLGNAKISRYLVDFSSYPGFARSTIPGIKLDSVKKRWGGIIPGPFLEGQYWALWTNKRVAEKIGIEIKQYNMTFDDLISYLKALDEYNKKHKEKIVPYMESGDWTTTYSIAMSLYLSLMGDAFEVGNMNFEDQKLEAWYKTLQALEKIASFNILNKNWRQVSWNDIRCELLYEKCLFFSNGSWMYKIWQQEDPSLVMNCVPNEYPAFGTNMPMYPLDYPINWGVLKNSPNKDLAVEMLLDMSKPAMADKWVRKTKCPTGVKGNLVSKSFATDQFENFVFYIQQKYGSNSYSMNDNSALIFGNKYADSPNYAIEVITGELTADDAMMKIFEAKFIAEAELENLAPDN